MNILLAILALSCLYFAWRTWRLDREAVITAIDAEKVEDES